MTLLHLTNVNFIEYYRNILSDLGYQNSKNIGVSYRNEFIMLTTTIVPQNPS